MMSHLNVLSVMALTLTSSMVLAQVPATSVSVPVKPAFSCSNFTRQAVRIDGQVQMRYVVTDDKELKCLAGKQPAAPWTVTKAAWSEQDEVNWRAFVYRIGKAVESGQCGTVDTCLASSANPYRGELELNGTFYSDCADFPTYMRAYFAYKNNLPMSFGTGLTANPPTQSQIDEAVSRVTVARNNLKKAEDALADAESLAKLQAEVKKAEDHYNDVRYAPDTRYSRNGNYFKSRMNVPVAGRTRDFFTYSDVIHDNISSGSLRMLFTPPGKTLPDFYATKINRSAITAGSVAYKPTGHVALVFEVLANGDVRMVDAHPDNSLTVLSFSNEFMRSLPVHAGGFKNFRPFQVLNPVYDQTTGAIVDGTIAHNLDSQLSNFSLEQYFGNAPVDNTDSKKARWVLKGQTVDFYEYVKLKLANGNVKINPVEQFTKDMRDLCTDLQQRSASVEAAIVKNIHTLAHPEALPRNIYGAQGEWEAYSTPGRDLRIRKRVQVLIENSGKYMSKLAAKDQFFDYKGSAVQLKEALIKIYNNENATCEISYKRSNGDQVTMGLGTALKRLTTMSFDPYFCPEVRWGAKYRSEKVTCADDTEKAEWYMFQQFLRNATERDPNEVMGWTLQDLKDLKARGAVDSGDKTSEYDILKKLKAL